VRATTINFGSSNAKRFEPSERFGLQTAFDCAIGEKLIIFASAADERPAFAGELPRFVSEVRRIFSADETRTHLARLECEQTERDAETREPDEDVPLYGARPGQSGASGSSRRSSQRDSAMSCAIDTAVGLNYAGACGTCCINAVGRSRSRRE